MKLGRECGVRRAACRLAGDFGMSSPALDLLLQDEPGAASEEQACRSEARTLPRPLPGRCQRPALPIREVLSCVRHGWCGAVQEFAMVV